MKLNLFLIGVWKIIIIELRRTIMSKIEPKIFDELKKVLKSFGNKYFVGDELNRSMISENLRSYDETLLSKLITIDFINKNYIKEVAGQKIFQIDQLEETILYDDYWDTSYTRYENHVGLTSNGKCIENYQDVVLDFPFKDGILTANMSKEDIKNSYDDAFLNEVIEKDEIDCLLDNKILNNVKRYDIDGEKNNDIFDVQKDNLISKGNNLLALNSIKDVYSGSAQLIYLDPPYFFPNPQDTDSFPYNPNFKLSTWLVFLKNRLNVALDFLTQGGYLAVQMNDYGFFHLKVLLDELFKSSEGGFVNDIIVKMSDLSGPKMAHTSKKVPKVKEHILIYTNDFSKAKLNSVRIPTSWESAINSKRYTSFVNKNGKLDPRKWEYTTVKKHLKDMGLTFGTKEADKYLLDNADCVFRTGANAALTKISKENHYDPSVFTEVVTSSGMKKFVYKNEEVLLATSKIASFNGIKIPSESISDIWGDIALNDLSNEGGITFSNGEKPEALLKRIVELTTSENDLVLDFFMGSATTQAVALKMQRRFIGIEQMDYIKGISVKRLINTIKGEKRGISKDINWQGGGSFVYAELMQKNMGYLQDIVSSKTIDELNEVYNHMLSGVEESQEAADISFKADLDKIEWRTTRVKFDDQKRLLIKLLDKNGLYYNYSEIDDMGTRQSLTDNDYRFNRNFYKKGE